MSLKYLLGSIILLMAATANAEPENLAGTRPNIILVMTDDQGMGDLSCMGNPVLNTPNIDRFYERATRFTDFHVSPTCAPTRSAIFSGRHEFRNGVTHTTQEREMMAVPCSHFSKIQRHHGQIDTCFLIKDAGKKIPIQTNPSMKMRR